MKITNLFMTAIIAIAISCTTPAPNKSVSIIPKPQNLELLSGNFVLSKNTTVVISEGENVKKVAEYFINKMNSVSKLGLKIQTGNAESCSQCISLSLLDEITNPEAYKLLVSEEGVNLEAQTSTGLFYGIQTLLQLLPPEVEGSEKISGNLFIPSVKIEDEPRFAWRGMHLDESRHFQGTELVKKYIDMLAMHKLNVFHWHLTDEQGWRIEIKKYPKLTEIGAWRVDRDYEPWGLSDEQRKPFEPGEPLHGGFYTQDEIREIVKYAEDRFITIVPEIEMPGHSQAALVCYPEFSCFGRADHVPVGMYTAEDWNFSDPYCVGNDKTFEFLENVLTEVMALFPSEYIHIGGDECRKVRWEECPKCQNV